LAFFAWSTAAHAAQFIEGADTRPVEVTISAKDQNVLSVQGRRLDKVIPSRAGVLAYKQDQAAGTLYFSLTSDETQTVSVFATDSAGVRYQLLLVPKPVAAQDIVLKPGADPAATSNRTSSSSSEMARSASYQRRIKDLVYAMTDTENLSGLESVPINQEVPLWKEAKLIFERRFVDGDFIGERYLLTNVSQQDMVLVEQELFRSGVVGISIDNHTLPPTHQTAVYVVRLRGQRD
jgi:conjugal transfer pilus assembly protein TraK